MPSNHHGHQKCQTPWFKPRHILILANTIPDERPKSSTNLGIPGFSITNDENLEISQQVLNGKHILVFGLPKWFVNCVKLHTLDSYDS